MGRRFGVTRGASCGGLTGAEYLDEAIDTFTNQDIHTGVRLAVYYPHTWSLGDVDRLLQAFSTENTHLDDELVLELLANSSCGTSPAFRKMIDGLSSTALPSSQVKTLVVKYRELPDTDYWGPREYYAPADPEMCQHALAPLLKTPATTLRSLQMKDLVFDKRSFRHVALALKSSSVSSGMMTVEFRSCKFDKAATGMFIATYKNKGTPLQSLALTMSPRMCGADSNEFSIPLPKVVQAILGRKSRLAKLVFQVHQPLDGGSNPSVSATAKEFKSILKAVAKTKTLRSLFVTGSLFGEYLEGILETVPKLEHLQEFGFDGFRFDRIERAFKEANSPVILSVVPGDVHGTGVLSESELGIVPRQLRESLRHLKEALDERTRSSSASGGRLKSSDGDDGPPSWREISDAIHWNTAYKLQDDTPEVVAALIHFAILKNPDRFVKTLVEDPSYQGLRRRIFVVGGTAEDAN